MTPDHDRLTDARARADLLRAHAAFLAAVEPPAAALPAVVGLVRAVAGLGRFALDVALEPSAADPIAFTPRILRAA